jgi:hypothetical protein
VKLAKREGCRKVWDIGGVWHSYLSTRSFDSVKLCSGMADTAGKVHIQLAFLI